MGDNVLSLRWLPLCLLPEMVRLVEKVVQGGHTTSWVWGKRGPLVLGWTWSVSGTLEWGALINSFQTCCVGWGAHGSFFWAMLLGRAHQFSWTVSASHLPPLSGSWVSALPFMWSPGQTVHPSSLLQVTLASPASPVEGPLASTVSLSSGMESSPGSYTGRHLSIWPHCTSKFIWTDCFPARYVAAFEVSSSSRPRQVLRVHVFNLCNKFPREDWAHPSDPLTLLPPRVLYRES